MSQSETYLPLIGCHVNYSSRGCQSKISIVEPNKLNRSQLSWLVESIELNRTDRSDNQSDRSDDWIQLNIYISLGWLVSIDFDWFNQSVRSSSIDLIGQFDWFDRSVQLSRSISPIDLIDQFDWVSGFTFYNLNFRLSLIKFSFSTWGLKSEW